MLVKTTEKALVRDTVSRSLINNDIDGYRAYKTQRETRNQLATLIREVEILKTEIDGLKKQTQQLIEKS